MSYISPPPLNTPLLTAAKEITVCPPRTMESVAVSSSGSRRTRAYPLDLIVRHLYGKVCPAQPGDYREECATRYAQDVAAANLLIEVVQTTSCSTVHVSRHNFVDLSHVSCGLNVFISVFAAMQISTQNVHSGAITTDGNANAYE